MTEVDATAAYAELLGPLRLPRPYCPVEPTVKQEWFLRRPEQEAFFGGAAGPGKSWGLLMAALMFVDVPGYDALLLRPTLVEFEQRGGLIEVAHEWLDDTDASWHGTRREWTFPSGATLRFGYLAKPSDVRQYKGAAYSFVGFDELTGFDETLYRVMSRVLRQRADGQLDDVPVRKRGASNPGDKGHTWVKTRFVDPLTRAPGVGYVPATIHDNPHLDYETYLETLADLAPIDRARLIAGDWDVMEEGGKFDRNAFKIIEPDEAGKATSIVRYWDLAASEPSASRPSPDYTVGLRLERTAAGRFTVQNVVRGQWGDAEVERRVRATAEADGRSVPVYVEQEPGASGKSLVGHYKRNVLAGYACHAGLPRSDKEVRARPVAAAVANELVDVVRATWTMEFLDECSIFPMGRNDDQVDALSGAHTKLTARGSNIGESVSVPTGRIPTVQGVPGG